MFEHQIIQQPSYNYNLDNPDVISSLEIVNKNLYDLQQNLEDNPDEVGFEKRIRPQNESYIFKKVQLPGIPRAEQIQKIVTSQQSKFVITKSNKLYRWRNNVDTEFNIINSIESSFKNNFNIKKKDKHLVVKNVFTDARGLHTIVIDQMGNCYYLYVREAKVRPIAALKGVKISAIAFNSPPINPQDPKSQLKSGDILYYKDGSGLCMLSLQLTEGDLVESSNQSIFQIPTFLPVTQIQIIKLKQTDRSALLVLISTAETLYYMSGQNDLPNLLQRYRDGTDKLKQFSLVKPIGQNAPIIQYKKAGIDFKIGYSKTTQRPLYLIWINGRRCIRFLIPSRFQKSLEEMLNRPQFLKFGKQIDQSPPYEHDVIGEPIAIHITEYHYYILFSDCFTIISLITQKVVHCESFKGNSLKNMVFDVSSGNFWIYDSKNIYRYDTYKERSQAWKSFIAEKRYKEAYNICKIINENVSFTTALYADYLFEKKQYIQSAKLYVETSRTFEEVFLKFFQKQPETHEGLIEYVHAWLQILGPDQNTQRCLLLYWLIEAYIHDITSLSQTKFPPKPDYHNNKLKKKQQQMQSLISTNKNILNFNLIKHIMISHGRIQDYKNFVSSKKNVQEMVRLLIAEEQYCRAIEYLKVENENINITNLRKNKEEEEERIDKKNEDKKKKRKKKKEEETLKNQDKYESDDRGNTCINEVFYRYANIFFMHEAERTLNALTKQIKKFNPSKFNSSLMWISPQDRIHGIEFLKYCILELRTKDKKLHNKLIFFYVNSPRKKISEMIQMIKKNQLNFDLNFGLRLFRAHNIPEAEIFIYGKIQQFSRAVALALQNNKQELAKYYANKPESQSLRKQLWIQIVKYYLNDDTKRNQVLDLVKQSGFLKIQDILPYFNQNIKIQNFKEELCQSLEEHYNTIEELNSLIKSYSSNAQQLKNQLKAIDNTCTKIDSSSKCEECYKTLFSMDFYMFPCLHGFHKECLLEAIKTQPILDIKIKSFMKQQEQNKQFSSIKQPLPTSLPSTSASTTKILQKSSQNTKKQKKQEFQFLSEKQKQEFIKNRRKEFDEMMASECIYCGPGIVDTIKLQFSNEELKKSWQV